MLYLGIFFQIYDLNSVTLELVYTFKQLWKYNIIILF
jgi:hypothetical protein